MLKVILLGIVEGFTEFLPISSTGHLILVGQWLDFSGDFSQMFNIVIQLGAILSVIVLYFQQLWPLAREKDGRLRWQKPILATWKFVIVGVIPAVILGVLFADLIETYLMNPVVVAAALILGGMLILLIERVPIREKQHTDLSNLGFGRAAVIGVCQCIAMIPGVSRSAATIIGGRLTGLRRETAARYSFFLAIPTLCGASVWSLYKHVIRDGLLLDTSQWLLLSVGFFVSFVVAMLVISLFMKYISRHSFNLFGWYRILLGLLVLGMAFWG